MADTSTNQGTNSISGAIERINKLKELVQNILGENNDELIESKLLSIREKIKQLVELKEKLGKRMELLKSSYENASELLDSTDDIEKLYKPMENMKKQIDEVINFNENDLENTINDLNGLISNDEPERIGNIRREIQSEAQGQPQQQNRSDQTFRNFPFMSPLEVESGNDNKGNQQGGYRYGKKKTNKSKRKTRKGGMKNKKQNRKTQKSKKIHRRTKKNRK